MTSDFQDLFDRVDEKAYTPDGHWNPYLAWPDISEALKERDDEIERLRAELDEAQLASIEARDPGIDMEAVQMARLEGLRSGNRLFGAKDVDV
jgi:hypothetical protein